MKNEGSVLNSGLLIMLTALIHSPHRLRRNMVLRMLFTSPMFKTAMQQMGLAVFLFRVIK